jgi:alpha-beta hydrolase superfamily lysophospholipase
MSADLQSEGSELPRTAQAEALYFDSGSDRLFGWLHRAGSASGSSLGLVLCSPFGYEASCAHRGIRRFAEAAASLGLPSLRFDYAGTGDSSDIDPSVGQLEIWSRSIADAVRELRERTGVVQVCLLGFRLGSLLATLALPRCVDVSALIAIAPVVSGRRYLRDLRLTRLAAAVGQSPDAPAPLDDRSVATSGAMEVSGYRLSAATIEALKQIELPAAVPPGVSDLLVIDRADLPSALDWANQATAAGVRTTYAALPGFVEMCLTAPHLASVPQQMLDRTEAWLANWRQSVDTPSRTIPHDFPVNRVNLLSLSDCTEQTVSFGPNGALFGVVTEPVAPRSASRAVILLNAGADHHIGANRMHVSLARRWAPQGCVVLRMDLAGIGDSATRTGRPDDETFPPAAIDDIRAAIHFIHTRYGAIHITLGGLCSGAYHALRAAVAGLPVNCIVMFNAQNYFWSEGMTLSDLQEAEVVRNPGVYRERVFSAAAWRRLFRGNVNIRRVVMIYAQRVRWTMESAIRELTRGLGIRLPRDLGWELLDIRARGVEIVFVFARGEPGIGLLKLQAGSAVKRLGDACRLRIVESGDHTFTESSARAVLEDVLSDELFARNP